MLLNTNTGSYLLNVKVSADRYNSLLDSCLATETPVLSVESIVFATVPAINVN